MRRLADVLTVGLSLLLASLAVAIALPSPWAHASEHMYSGGSTGDGTLRTTHTASSGDSVAWPLSLLGGSTFIPDRRESVRQTASSLALTYSGSSAWNLFRQVKITGHYAYCAAPYGLVIVDISDPLNPILVSSTHIEHQRILGLDVSGSLAYLTGLGYIQAVDVSSPEAPALLGHLWLPGASVTVSVKDTVAYVADVAAGLTVVNVTNPSNLIIISTFDTPGQSWDVAITDTIAWVADKSSVQVLDISDLTQPERISSFAPAGYSYGIKIKDTIGYVASSYYGLHTVDVRDPTNPQVLGQRIVSGQCWRLALKDNYAFIAAEYVGLRVVNASVPTNPLLVASVDLRDDVWDVALTNDVAAVVGTNTGLTLVGTTALPQLSVLGSVGSSPGQPRRIAKVGPRLYAACGEGGTCIFDCSVPGQPTLLGKYATQGFTFDVAIAGPYAFIAEDTVGLQVLDVSDPANPLHVADLDSPGWALGVTVSGDYCWLSDWEGGLRRIDISDPRAPFTSGVYGEGTVLVRQIQVRDSTVFVTDGRTKSHKVIILNWPATGTPTELGQITLPDEPKDLVVRDSLMFIADNDSGIAIVNVADLEHPTILAACSTLGTAQGITLSENYALVATLSYIEVFDIEDPAHPVPVGTYKTAGDAWHAVADAQLCWVADTWALLELNVVRSSVLGDVNCDECVDLSDVVLLGNYLDGLAGTTVNCLEAAGDLNGNGSIDSEDYEILYDTVAGAGP